MSSICDEFINGLDKKYLNSDDKLIGKYKTFLDNKKGIDDSDLKKLKKEYPNIPESLIKLLKYSDGTNIYCFQSDGDGDRYYLISSSKMLEAKNEIQMYFSDFISRKYDDIMVDDRITNDVNSVHWLLFSNGGASMLFIDFTPSKDGKVGQIVRYLHDPDEMLVIADSFDEFLKQIIDSDYKFVDGMVEANKFFKKHKPVKEKNSLASLILFLILGLISILVGVFLFLSSSYFLGIFFIFSSFLYIYTSVSGFKNKRKK